MEKGFDRAGGGRVFPIVIFFVIFVFSVPNLKGMNL